MVEVSDFFKNSSLLDHMVLRPLSHIKPNWELTWSGNEYEPEEDSFASLLNTLNNRFTLKDFWFDLEGINDGVTKRGSARKQIRILANSESLNRVPL